MNFINSAPRAGAGATPGIQREQFTELSMYKERPAGEISLEEFEEYALDRLRVLKAIEEAKLRSKSDDTVQSDVERLWKNHMQKATSNQHKHRKDILSHHILRLAYCRTADLRAWLLAQETLLFKYRFKMLHRDQQVVSGMIDALAAAAPVHAAAAAADGQRIEDAIGQALRTRATRRPHAGQTMPCTMHVTVDFFRSMELPYHPISDAEADELAHELADVLKACGDKEKARIMEQKQPAGSRNVDTYMPDSSKGRPVFYKVPFQAVPDLVGSRRVLLRGGLAYVGEDQVYSLVVGTFRSCLSASLVEAAHAWGQFSAAEADRLAPLVDTLPSRSVNATEGKKVPVGEISAGQLHGLVAGRHFPLCMTVMYERLANEHHLKHWGLQQFTLFLKTIGLPLEQALLFFRQQFSPRTAGDKFNKEYAYNIRYNYGQEGKRENWSEWSCVKIISQEVGGACSAPCECNGGCPYKTYDANQLRTALTRLHCSDKVIKDVIDKARGKHYQLACGLAFEGITGSPQETGINKPSEYYAASIELANKQQQQQSDGSGQQQQQAQQQQRTDGPPQTPSTVRTAA